MDKRPKRRRNQCKIGKKTCVESLDEFPIELYNQEDQHYNPEDEENQHTKRCPISWMKKNSTGVTDLGLNADCGAQQDSLQLHDAQILDQGNLKTDHVQGTQACGTGETSGNFGKKKWVQKHFL